MAFSQIPHSDKSVSIAVGDNDLAASHRHYSGRPQPIAETQKRGKNEQPARHFQNALGVVEAAFTQNGVAAYLHTASIDRQSGDGRAANAQVNIGISDRDRTAV